MATPVAVIEGQVVVGFDRAKLGAVCYNGVEGVVGPVTLFRAETDDRRGSPLAENYLSPRFVTEPKVG